MFRHWQGCCLINYYKFYYHYKIRFKAKKLTIQKRPLINSKIVLYLPFNTKREKDFGFETSN